MKKIARQKLQFSQQVLVLHVKRGHAAQKEAQLRRSFIDQLKELKTEEEEQLEAFKSQTSSKFSEEKERIQAKKKGIRKHLTHVRLDLEMLLKSEETVHQSIASQTQSFKEDLNKLNQDRDAVQAEIKELMRLLAQKRKEEEELTRQIHGLERNVVLVTDRFKNEMERIGIERDAIAKDNHKYSLQMEELKKAKRQLKGEEAKDREAEKRFHDALAAIEAELTNERAAVDKLEQKEDELLRAKTNYEAFVRMEAEQEEQTSACSAAITQLTARVLSLQQEIHGANQQIVALDARIPSLESEKKLAVSGRNFKEAKRIAEEMKTASVQIEESKDTVAALTEQLETCKVTLSQHKEQFKSLDQELSSAESKADKVKLERLTAKEKELLSKLARYHGQDEETEMSALELESCQAEMASLRLKWNLPQHDEDDADAESESESERKGKSEDDNVAMVEETSLETKSESESDNRAPEAESEDQKSESEEQGEGADSMFDAAAAEEELRVLAARVEAWEAELEQCVANDDFDRADEVNQEIERAKARSAVLQAALPASSSSSSGPAPTQTSTNSSPDEEPSAFAFIPRAEDGGDVGGGGDDDGDEAIKSDRGVVEVEADQQPSVEREVEASGDDGADQTGFAFISEEEEAPKNENEGENENEDVDDAEQVAAVVEEGADSSSSFAFMAHDDNEEEGEEEEETKDNVAESEKTTDDEAAPAEEVEQLPPVVDAAAASFAFIIGDDEDEAISHNSDRNDHKEEEQEEEGDGHAFSFIATSEEEAAPAPAPTAGAGKEEEEEIEEEGEGEPSSAFSFIS